MADKDGLKLSGQIDGDFDVYLTAVLTPEKQKHIMTAVNHQMVCSNHTYQQGVYTLIVETVTVPEGTYEAALPSKSSSA